MKKLNAKFKLWLSNNQAEGIFGDGKWRLLKTVGQKGSLQAASNALGISYRKAWGDLKKAEKYLHVSLVDKHRGGRKGGSTELTDAGRVWVKAYEGFRNDVEKAVEKAYARNFVGLAK